MRQSCRAALCSRWVLVILLWAGCGALEHAGFVFEDSQAYWMSVPSANVRIRTLVNSSARTSTESSPLCKGDCLHLIAQRRHLPLVRHAGHLQRGKEVLRIVCLPQQRTIPAGGEAGKLNCSTHLSLRPGSIEWQGGLIRCTLVWEPVWITLFSSSIKPMSLQLPGRWVRSRMIIMIIMIYWR